MTCERLGCEFGGFSRKLRAARPSVFESGLADTVFGGQTGEGLSVPDRVWRQSQISDTIYYFFE